MVFLVNLTKHSLHRGSERVILIGDMNGKVKDVPLQEVVGQ